MLFAVSGLEGAQVRATDGKVGAVKDFLFDDETWKIRWMAVDAGHWLPGRRDTGVRGHPPVRASGGRARASDKRTAPRDVQSGH